MSIIEGENLALSREEIYSNLIASMQSLVSDVYTGSEGNLMLLFQVLSGAHEAIYLALQIANEDMFVVTANPSALDRHGIDKDVERKVGTRAVGNLRIEGAGGEFIPLDSEAAFDPNNGDELLYFRTTAEGTTPTPGSPLAPALTDLATAGNLTGTFEYVVTFVTVEGETMAGAESLPLTVAASRIHLSGIQIGGTGTIRRNIYRQKNGDGVYKFVAQIANNTATVYDDNIADGALGGQPPLESTAEAITLPVESVDPGFKYNVLPNTITSVVDMPNGITDVRNPAQMTGGSDPEDTEKYRARLLAAIQVPGTGSPGDLKSWAESVDGVEQATVFKNDNLGTPTNGHVTVRIAGPGGAIPDGATIAEVQTLLDSYDMANVTIHVSTFTAVPTNVAVTVTVAAGYTLPDISAGIAQAISDYITALPVGATLRVAGIVDAVFGLPGVDDVVVTTPSGNLATGQRASELLERSR
jgi:uncharacterized phage protein gp47/JayE